VQHQQKQQQQEQNQQEQQRRKVTALTPTKRKATWTPPAQDHGDASELDKLQDQACGLACKHASVLVASWLK